MVRKSPRPRKSERAASHRHHLESEAAAIYEQPLVLVRPDGHVAWRGRTPPADPLAMIDRVRGA